MQPKWPLSLNVQSWSLNLALRRRDALRAGSDTPSGPGMHADTVNNCARKWRVVWVSAVVGAAMHRHLQQRADH